MKVSLYTALVLVVDPIQERPSPVASQKEYTDYGARGDGGSTKQHKINPSRSSLVACIKLQRVWPSLDSSRFRTKTLRLPRARSSNLPDQ